MKKLGLHRVDGRSYWFAAYFNPFHRERMIRYAGLARADRFHETFSGRIPFADARIVKVYDPDPLAAEQFADTFNVEIARNPDEFARGLDGVIVPFPSGGHSRDYAVTAPFAERGLPLSLDRIILEQSPQLQALCARVSAQRTPLQITCFIRYLSELFRPAGAGPARTVTASTGGDPVGYGADLLDLVDELMQGQAVSVRNAGSRDKNDLHIRYADGREAILQLTRHGKAPMQVAASGEGWSRSLTIDGSQYHLGAMRQFEAFLRSIDTREPPVPYARVQANAAILHTAQRQEFDVEIPLNH
jgi:hypothetical protein